MNKDWTEDFDQYSCFCINCGHEFKGHKQRITCKACALKSITERITDINYDLAVLMENKRKLEELCPHDWDTVSLNDYYTSNICKACGIEIIVKG